MTGRMHRKSWPRIAAGAAGFAWYLWIGGAPSLNPTHLGWLLKGDWAQHVLGWLLFRSEPWRLPLGSLPSALYPVGSTIGFTDSNPLLSIVLKPFAPHLPSDFQFIGPWLACC